MSECESMMTEYDDPARMYHGLQQPPMLFLPPPPEHPPPSDIGTPPDSPTQNRSRMVVTNPAHQQHMAAFLPGRTGSYHSNTTGSRDDSPHFRNSPMVCGNSSGHSDNEQFRQPYGMHQNHVQQPPPYGSLGCNHRPAGWGAHNNQPTYENNPHAMQQQQAQPLLNGHGGGHYRTVEGPNSLASQQGAHLRAYSPRAMSEPERGPTPPIRAYKLVPIRDSAANEVHRHYSDTEGAPAPPLRMMSNNSHAGEEPPSPAPEDMPQGHGLGNLVDPTRDCAIQSSLPSLANESINGGSGGHPHHQNMMGRAGSSPSSELGNFESDMEGGRRTPESSVGGDVAGETKWANYWFIIM